MLSHWWAYLAPGLRPAKTFYHHLKLAYELVSDLSGGQTPKDWQPTNSKRQDFLHCISAISPRTGVSIADLESHLVASPKVDTDFHPESQLPDFSSWQMYVEDLKNLETRIQDSVGN